RRSRVDRLQVLGPRPLGIVLDHRPPLGFAADEEALDEQVPRHAPKRSFHSCIAERSRLLQRPNKRRQVRRYIRNLSCGSVPPPPASLVLALGHVDTPPRYVVSRSSIRKNAPSSTATARCWCSPAKSDATQRRS